MEPLKIIRPYWEKNTFSGKCQRRMRVRYKPKKLIVALAYVPKLIIWLMLFFNVQLISIKKIFHFALIYVDGWIYLDFSGKNIFD